MDITLVPAVAPSKVSHRESAPSTINDSKHVKKEACQM